MKILLHVCCAPCSTEVINRLSSHELTFFYYNPNIHPEEEYQKRLENVRKIADRFGLELLEGKYDKDDWFKAVKGLENEPEGGKRCTVCFDMRLKKTAEQAKMIGSDAFATTLTISPHKNADIINDIGKKYAEEQGLVFIDDDFKKCDGFVKSVNLSKKFGLYRQKYCGCVYSDWTKNKKEKKKQDGK